MPIRQSEADRVDRARPANCHRASAVVLDSFAGSGTTAHAVLLMNAVEGNRRFILVECEDYADSLTAERVRRVMQGYKFEGMQKEELLREPITFNTLKGASKVMSQIEALANLEGHRFDNIKREVKEGILTVTAKNISRRRSRVLAASLLSARSAMLLIWTRFFQANLYLTTRPWSMAVSRCNR